MSDINKKVAIIIVTWKGMKWIDTCLNSIRNSLYPATVFVIDNNSPDETPDYIEKNFPEVELTRSDKNLGFGKANNLAIRQAMDAGFDYFFLLNQDAYLQPDTINCLLREGSDGDYGIISPIHLNGDATAVDFYFRDFVLAQCPDYLDATQVGFNGRIVFESEFIPAAAWLLPRKTVEEIGGFDPLFYHYGEDDNYCSRVRYHQRKIVFITNARVQHDRVGTIGNKKIYNKKLFFRNLLIASMDQTKSASFIIQKIGRQFYDDFGLWFMYLFMGKWSMLHNFIEDYFRLFCKVKQIKKDRKANKILQANWL
ncbi:glycosyltransferase family 2 protein [Bacteroides zhangwenhongii]|jgi:family 2 glycosyl transferase|uniref:glycosyltransferase family 2 protein n=1 Tax=Bacteroides zhangwenhongii TaxID=2650157 RepID=UPI0032C0A0E1